MISATNTTEYWSGWLAWRKQVRETPTRREIRASARQAAYMNRISGANALGALANAKKSLPYSQIRFRTSKSLIKNSAALSKAIQRFLKLYGGHTQRDIRHQIAKNPVAAKGLTTVVSVALSRMVKRGVLEKSGGVFYLKVDLKNRRKEFSKTALRKANESPTRFLDLANSVPEEYRGDVLGELYLLASSIEGRALGDKALVNKALKIAKARNRPKERVSADQKLGESEITLLDVRGSDEPDDFLTSVEYLAEEDEQQAGFYRENTSREKLRALGNSFPSRYLQAMDRVYNAGDARVIPLRSKATVYEELEKFGLVRRHGASYISEEGAVGEVSEGWVLTEMGRTIYFEKRP